MPTRDKRIHQDNVYEQLELLLEKVPKHDNVMMMGDFNCRVKRFGYGVGRWNIHADEPDGQI